MTDNPFQRPSPSPLPGGRARTERSAIPGACGPTRRDLLAFGGGLAAWSMLPRVASAAGARDPRLLTVILRGAMDGLTLAAPLGDPAWAGLREEAGLHADDDGLPLDGFFVLNPAMPRLHALFQRGEATIVHAVATPYRGRSHFSGQDLLETGLPEGGRGAEGWLNRALAALPSSGVVAPSGGLAVGTTVPLILRGAAPVSAWSPTRSTPIAPDTVDRLLALYAHTDDAMHDALLEAVRTEAIAGGAEDVERLHRGFRLAARGAGRLLAEAEGPRIGAVSFDGWDTHANQGPVEGRLARMLGALDAAIAELEEAMRPVWRDTVIAIVTEFGRTVRENGSDGTDHGTGTAAVLIGGAVRGGRVLADWPGLAPEALYEGRDLRPTLDLRAVMKGVLGDHLGLSQPLLASGVFPGSGAVGPVRDLLA